MSDLSNYTEQTSPQINPVQGTGYTSSVPPHTHNGVDSPLIDANANNQLISLTGDVTGGSGTPLAATLKTVNSNVGSFGSSTQIPSFTVDAKGRITAASNNTLTVNSIAISVTAGETLAQNDVVRLYGVSSVNYATDAYGMANGGLYAVLHAADDTTFGPTIFGVVTVGAAVGGTATIAIIGSVSWLTTLNQGSVYYSDNHSAASSTTITQTQQDATQAMTGVTVIQLINPTQDLLDSITLFYNAQSGPAGTLQIDIKRHNTLLQTVSGNFTNSALTECTLTCSPSIRTYKGETITLSITATRGLLGYKSGGSVYNGTASGGSIPANSDVYFKIKEFTNFGQINTTPGTRKFRVGQATATNNLVVFPQTADVNL